MFDDILLVNVQFAVGCVIGQAVKSLPLAERYEGVQRILVELPRSRVASGPAEELEYETVGLEFELV